MAGLLETFQELLSEEVKVRLRSATLMPDSTSEVTPVLPPGTIPAEPKVNQTTS